MAARSTGDRYKRLPPPSKRRSSAPRPTRFAAAAAAVEAAIAAAAAAVKETVHASDDVDTTTSTTAGATSVVVAGVAVATLTVMRTAASAVGTRIVAAAQSAPVDATAKQQAIVHIVASIGTASERATMAPTDGTRGRAVGELEHTTTLFCTVC